MSVTEEIKSRLDIVDVVSEHVQLRKSGRSYGGFCPFHSNSRTPAFYVFPETQTWRCFGACAEGGDIFSYVMKKENWDFKESLKYLAQRAGVVLKAPRPGDKKRKAVEDRLGDLLTAAANYFHQLFLHAPQAEFARQYIAKREFSAETQSHFLIGYSLQSWDACRSHFNAQGYNDEDLLKAGLLTENEEKGTRYDRFRNRLMIPIRDINGRVVGFGARTLEKDGIPKYLNSPQTPLFNKSHLLYGLDDAKRHIREARQAVIVEGYMDVMRGWQAGFRNIVAQMGTALTEQQLRLLKRYTKSFVMALDADAAGMKATMRSLQVARETLDREYEPHFNARGLVRYEGRLKADIKIITMPEGKDPDDIIREDPSHWPKLLKQAKPVVAYVVDMLTGELDLNDPKAKSAIAQKVLPLVNDIADPVEREHYRQYLARSLRVDERTLKQVKVVDRLPRKKKVQPQTNINMPPPPPTWDDEMPAQKVQKKPRKINSNMKEMNFLRQCLHYPFMIRDVNRLLKVQGQSFVEPSDFSVSEDQALLDHFYQRAKQTTVVTIDELCDSLDDVLSTRVQSLLTISHTPESERDRLPERLTMSVLDWRLEQVQKRMGQLRQIFIGRSSQDDSDVNQITIYNEQFQNLRLSIQQLNRAKDGMSSGGRRRAEVGNGR